MSATGDNKLCTLCVGIYCIRKESERCELGRKKYYQKYETIHLMDIIRKIKRISSFNPCHPTHTHMVLFLSYFHVRNAVKTNLYFLCISIFFLLSKLNNILKYAKTTFWQEMNERKGRKKRDNSLKIFISDVKTTYTSRKPLIIDIILITSWRKLLIEESFKNCLFFLKKNLKK